MTHLAHSGLSLFFLLSTERIDESYHQRSKPPYPTADSSLLRMRGRFLGDVPPAYRVKVHNDFRKYSSRHKNVRVSVPLNGRSTGLHFHKTGIRTGEKRVACFRFPRSGPFFAMPFRAVLLFPFPASGLLLLLKSCAFLRALYLYTAIVSICNSLQHTLSIVSLAAGSARLVHCCPGHERSPRAMRSVSKYEQGVGA